MQNFNYQGGYYQQPANYETYTPNYYTPPTTAYPQASQPIIQPQVVTNQRDTSPPTGSNMGMLPLEQSFIENILRLNKGKFVSVYCTFENNSEWNAKIFDGIIQAAGRDHVILSERDSEKRVLIPMVYVDYVVFYEEINYEYPQFSGGTSLATYNPR